MRLLAFAALLLAAPAGFAQTASLDASYQTFSLDEGFMPDPWSTDLTAGGTETVAVEGCGYGTVADAPDAELSYATSGETTLYIYAISDVDVTLLVNTAEGEWVCDDDSLGNGDPLLILRGATDGIYDIWVGTYGTDLAPATLYVSEIDPR